MEPESDALQNSLILDNIFVRLRVFDQKEFRLVSKLWEKSSVERWRRSVQIQINLNDDEKQDVGKDKEELENRTKRKRRGMKDFLEFWNNSEDEGHPHPLKNIPFRNFKLSSHRNLGEIELQGDVEGDSTLMGKFWEICSPKMESLSLDSINVKGGFLPTMKWILFESNAAGVRRRVELKELAIERCSFNSLSSEAPTKLVDEQNTEIAEKLTSLKLIMDDKLKAPEIAGLLQLLPNLKKLSAGIWAYYHCNEVVKALAISSEANKKNKKNPIQLEVLQALLHSDTISHLKEYIKTSKPKFKKLHLKFRVYMDTSYFNQVILNPSSSSMLTKLKISLKMEDRYWITDFTGYSFPQLNEFHLGITGKEQNVRFDFKAFYGMPNLKSFECKKNYVDVLSESLWMNELMSEGKDKWMGEQEVEVQQNGSPVHLQLDKLEKLKFKLPRNFDEESLKEVASWMKQLKKLSLVFKSEDIFKAALQLWPDLEEVTFLWGSKVSEKFIQEERGNRSMKVFMERKDFAMQELL